MSHLQIYEDPLDASTITIEQTDNVLKRFLEIKAKFTQARIYKNTPCPENEVTPIDKVTALKLLDAGPEDQFHIVCHAGDIISAVNYVVVKIFGSIVKPQQVPTLLFNHRNKKPESEKRSVNFGVNKDYDGVKLKWVDPTDSWSESEIKLPNDNVVNARELEIKGITNLQQAMLLAHRAMNKLLYQKKTVEFSAYSEADLVTRNDLILVADDTRPMLISSGSVIDQDGLYLTLSQQCVLEQDESYVVHLQLPNGQVDVVQVTQGDSGREVLLARAPTSQLVIEYEGNISCSTYLVTTDTYSKRDLFLITEKSGGGTESSITAINYTDQYYLNDKDYV